MVAHLPPAALGGGRGAALSRALAAGLVAVLAALFVRTFVVEIVQVPSGSMAPALVAGDRVAVDRLVYGGGSGPLAWLLPSREPAAGDVVVFRSPEERRRLLVKRCVATGGEPFAGSWVPPDTLVLLGDARESSHDSRAFGPVGRGAVVGRAALVLWSIPPGSARPRWGRTLARVR